MLRKLPFRIISSFLMFKRSIKLLSLFLFPISVFSYVDTVSLLKNIEQAQSGL